MNKQTMTDKEYMEDILLTSKQLAGLYQHAVTEASTESLHCQFKTNLNESIDIQNHIFQTMSSKGWYPQEAAPAQQVNKVKTKFQSSSM